MITRDPLAEWIPHGYTGEAYVNRRKVIVTPKRVCIGLLYTPPKPAQNSAEAFAEDIIMHRGGPFWAVQRMVLELCAARRTR